MELHAALRQLASYGISAAPNVEKSDGFRTYPITKPNKVLTFNTPEEALDYWERRASHAVFHLYFYRVLCKKALALRPQDQKLFNDWAEGKRPFMPKRLSRLNFSVLLTTNWRDEAHELASRYGSIADVTLANLLAQARSELAEILYPNTMENDIDEPSLAGQGVQQEGQDAFGR